MGSKIEALFGGVLALFIVVAAVVALFSFPGVKSGAGKAPNALSDPLATVAEINAKDTSVICQCYDGGFALAGSDVDVMSSQYRTGYEQCRALGAVKAAMAWTDGWNARLSAKPYEASCKSYRRNKKI